jgi:hypothetical protein
MNFFTSLAQLRNGFGGIAKKSDAQSQDGAREDGPFLSVDDFDLPEPMKRAIEKMSSDTNDQLDPPEDAFDDDLDDDLDMSDDLDMDIALESAAADTYTVDEVDAMELPEITDDQDDPMSLMARVARAAELLDAPKADMAEDQAPEIEAAEFEAAEVAEDITEDAAAEDITEEVFDMVIDIEIQRDPSDPRVLDATELTLFQYEDGTTGADVVFHLCGADSIPEVCGTVRLLSNDVLNLDDIAITITETAA